MSNSTDVPTINGPGDLRANILAASIVPWVLASISVALRFWSRRLSKVKIGWNDWLCLMAGVASLFQFGIGWWWYSIGGGKYIGEVSVDRVRASLTIIFLVELSWGLVMFLCRASALALWRRLFTYQWVKWFCWIWRVLNVAWAIAGLVAICTHCTPAWAFFNPLEAPAGACARHTQSPLFIFGISNIILDIGVLMVPLVVCYGLHLNNMMKLILCGMFATGSFTIFVTIVRLATLSQSGVDSETVDSDNIKTSLNVTWVWAELGYWAVAETNIAIVSTSLPCLRPVVIKLVPSSWVTWPTRKSSNESRPLNRVMSGTAFARSSGSANTDQTPVISPITAVYCTPSSATYIAGGNAEKGRGRSKSFLASHHPTTELYHYFEDNRTRERSQNRILVKDDVSIRYE